MATLHLVGPLGTKLSVEVASEREVIPTLRTYGEKGWTSGELPPGGLSLPYAMADVFDFSLIGGHPYTNRDGEACVMYRGQSYKRRELDEVDTKKMRMPACVKYSRGARPTDLPHLKEGEDGGVQYVTLISFRGGGRVLSAYIKPDLQVQVDGAQAAD